MPSLELYRNRRVPLGMSAALMRTAFACSMAFFVAATCSAADPADHERHEIAGWTVYVSDALREKSPAETETAIELLRSQLEEVVRLIPAGPLKELRETRIWLSPTPEGAGPTGEYHPDAGWLRDHGRDVAMAKAIQFTNVLQFTAEIKRMPNMVLHELAHAYHDRVLGFEHPEIEAAYERAKASGTYDAVRERSSGAVVRSYALTNAKEYFAESTEAYFGTNDLFPFQHAELIAHDPAMETLLAKLWQVDDAARPTDEYRVQSPPAALGLAPFYEKYVDAHGYPIIASKNVDDYALKEAAYLVDLMLARRPDVRRAMAEGGSRLIVIAHNEFTTDIPEHSHLEPKEFWDARARGLGGSQDDPVCSCGEENLLAYEGDPYSTENILIHEFAHNIHLRGMVRVDATFDDRVRAAYDDAMKQGLWKGKYGATNHHEYFAEGVQSWFDNNREDDHDHNHVNTRAELREYDPALAKLCEEAFGETELVYTKPTTRITGHLAGYDPSKAPKFAWPERLQNSREEIRRKAKERSEKANAAPKSTNE